MTKRKKATSAASRGTRGGRLSAPPRVTGATRVTKSNSTPTPDAEPVEVQPQVQMEPAKEPETALALAAECTVADAASLKERLAGLLDQPLAVTLDVSALQRIDTAGLQVIAAFVRQRAEHDRKVMWQGSAPALTGAAKLLGLTSLLGLPA
jgi:ABC-type transporter Mla MlaB component